MWHRSVHLQVGTLALARYVGVLPPRPFPFKFKGPFKLLPRGPLPAPGALGAGAAGDSEGRKSNLQLQCHNARPGQSLSTRSRPACRPGDLRVTRADTGMAIAKWDGRGGRLETTGTPPVDPLERLVRVTGT